MKVLRPTALLVVVAPQDAMRVGLPGIHWGHGMRCAIRFTGCDEYHPSQNHVR